MSLRQEWRALAVIAAAFLAGAAYVHPLRDVPVMDDWVYAWSVEHLLRTSRLRIIGFSSVYPVAQILWGTLFARIAGFSFGALRTSTLVVAALGCTAFYLTLREVGVSAGYSLLGALAIAFDPVYFALSFSFMTDVPFIAVVMIATLYYVQAFERDRPNRLWLGTLFTAIAFLIRPLALAVPAGALLCVRWRRADRVRWIAPLVVGLAAMAVIWTGLHEALGELDMEAMRLERVQWLFLVTFREYATWNAGVVFQSVFPFAPLLLPALTTRRVALGAAAAAAGLAVALRLYLGALPLPLPDWQTWSLQEISARAMIGGDAAASAWSQRAMSLLVILGLLLVACFVIACVSGHARTSRSAAVVVATGTMFIALVNALWLYNDRYFLVFAPAVAMLATMWLARLQVRPALAGALLAVWAAVALTGTRDMLDVEEACAVAAHDLEAAGVPAWDIDAGYPSNGWRLYVHPEHLRADEDPGEDVPYVTSKKPTRYKVANTPLPDYTIVRVMPLRHAWWQASDRLYVLRRTGA